SSDLAGSTPRARAASARLRTGRSWTITRYARPAPSSATAAGGSPAVMNVLPDQVVVDTGHLGHRRLVDRRYIGGSGIAASLLRVACPRDDGGHARLVEDPPQRELCHRVAA